MNKCLLSGFILCVLLLSGCDSRRVVYSDTYGIGMLDWNMDSVAEFETELLPGCYDMSLIVRNSGDYMFQNLWLFVSMETADTVTVDTVECFLADNYGRWLGRGSIGSVYTSEVAWADSVVLNDTAKVTYHIAHGMRYVDLKGIVDVGVMVVEH